MFLTTVHCDIFKSRGENRPYPPRPPQQDYPGSSATEQCQFYKVQSLIINCHESKGYLKAKIKQQKDTIASVCAKQAFQSVWKKGFNPSSYAYNPENTETQNFQWEINLGIKQYGNIPSPPNPLEMKYLNLLNQFKNSLDAGQLNSCLGGNYPFDGPTIIKTSIRMINLGMLEPETFIKCYKEQLELHRVKNNCSFF